MTSLFANQFGYRSPYSLGPLATGVPQVGIELPRSETPEDQESENQAPGASRAGTAVSAAANAAANQTVGVAGQQEAARQGTLSKLMHMPDVTTGDYTSTSPASSANGASAPAGGSGFGHWVAHTFDSARHGTANVADKAGGLFAQQQGIPNQYSPHVGSNVPGAFSVPNYTPTPSAPRGWSANGGYSPSECYEPPGARGRELDADDHDARRGTAVLVG